MQGSTGAPPSAGQQQKDKAALAGDEDAKVNGHVEDRPSGLAAKGATAAERAPTPGVPLLPPDAGQTASSMRNGWMLVSRCAAPPALHGCRTLYAANRWCLPRRGVALHA